MSAEAVIVLAGPLLALSAKGRTAFSAKSSSPVTPLDLDANFFLAMGLLAGAISLATAPAATLAIVDEKRGLGPVRARWEVCAAEARQL